ncbi:MAG: hypothetical protein ACOCVF_00305 [bacterium]
MANNARYYILNFNKHQAYGVGSMKTLTQRSLLDAFSIYGRDYPELTKQELAMLSDSEYETRLRDFLLYWGVDENQVGGLINEAINLEIIFKVYLTQPAFGYNWSDLSGYDIVYLLNNNYIQSYETKYVYVNSLDYFINNNVEYTFYNDEALTDPFDGLYTRWAINRHQDLYEPLEYSVIIDDEGKTSNWDLL